MFIGARSVSTWRGQKQAESDLLMVTDATILVCCPDRKLKMALGHGLGGAVSTEGERSRLESLLQRYQWSWG